MPPPSTTLESAPSKHKTMMLLEEEEESVVVVGSVAAVAAASSGGSLRTSSHVKGADDDDDPLTTEAKAADILARDAVDDDTNGSAAVAVAVASRKTGSAEATGTTATSAASVPEDDDGNDEDDGPPLLLLPSLRDVLECQISSWYPAFANVDGDETAADAAAAASSEQQYPPQTNDDDTSRSKHRRRRKRLTIRTVIVDLPNSFVASYLQSGQTVRLPPGSVTSSILRTGPPLPNEDSDDDDSDTWSSDGSSAEAEPHQSNGTELDQPNHDDDDDNDDLALLDDRIRLALDELGGSIMPKLNWSSPKDASWINAGSLKCQTPGDIYLLLQSSDFVSYDLCHALQDVAASTAANVNDDQKCKSRKVDGADATPTTFAGYKLALRKWCHLYPSHEFRCFVKDRRVVAISQRHSTSHFPHLVQQQKDKIRDGLVEFHDTYVANRFAVNQQGVHVVSNYVLDVYIDQHDKVWILDFNVWGSRTDSLLFTWKELESMASGVQGAAVMRVVETSKQVRHDPLSSYRAPIDAVRVASLAGGGVGGARAFEEFAKLCRRPSDLDDDDDGSSSSSDSASAWDEEEDDE